MSRTSRRVSRPLIGLLTIVIVLGVFFTVHKLRSARAAHAQSIRDVVLVTAAPAQPPAPKVAPATQPIEQSAITQVPAPSQSNSVETQLKNAEANALVTQTPTEKPRDDASPKSPQATLSDPATDAHDSDVPSDRRTSAPADLPKTTDAPKTEVASVEHVSPTSVSPAPAHSVAASPLSDAKLKLDSNDLLSARKILNDGLASGRLSGSDADAAKKQIEEINETLVFSAKKFPDDPWAGSYQVVGGERLGTIANKHSVSWELLARVNGVTPKKLRSGQWIKVFKGPFHAVVYKSQFRMELYLGAPGGEGSMYVRSFPVGLGKDNSTPTGLWICKAGDKIRNPRYYPPRGGDILAPDDPKNPLAGYWIAIEGLEGQALGKESYGIHGTIDPTSIGRMESMGCIRLKPQDISWVYDLLVDGKSKVLIKD